MTQGSSFLATLGWMIESFQDSEMGRTRRAAVWGLTRTPGGPSLRAGWENGLEIVGRGAHGWDMGWENFSPDQMVRFRFIPTG